MCSYRVRTLLTYVKQNKALYATLTSKLAIFTEIPKEKCCRYCDSNPRLFNLNHRALCDKITLK